MKRRSIAGTLIVVLLIGLWGCQTITEEDKGAAIGAGAAAGTAVGLIIGRSTKGAVIGGLVGALLGGHRPICLRQTADNRRDRSVYNYKSTEGMVLTLEEASVSPQTAHPGDDVEIKMSYAVLNPSAEARIVITETREIMHDGELVGEPEVQVERADGT